MAKYAFLALVWVTALNDVVSFWRAILIFQIGLSLAIDVL
jgi:hypothetical protein